MSGEGKFNIGRVGGLVRRDIGIYYISICVCVSVHGYIFNHLITYLTLFWMLILVLVFLGEKGNVPNKQVAVELKNNNHE